MNLFSFMINLVLTESYMESGNLYQQYSPKYTDHIGIWHILCLQLRKGSDVKVIFNNTLVPDSAYISQMT